MNQPLGARPILLPVLAPLVGESIVIQESLLRLGVFIIIGVALAVQRVRP